MTRVIIFSLFVFRFSASGAQAGLTDEEKNYFEKVQDSLARYVHLEIKAVNNAGKMEYNAQFLTLLDEALNHTHSEKFSFDSLQKFKMLLIAPDKELRVFTWNMAMDDETQRYFGYIQHLEKNTGKWSLTKLEDRSEEIKNPDNSLLTAEKWYGCWYYRIIETYVKQKKFYTLLGWDGNDHITQKKLIETVTFNSNGEPEFAGNFEVHKLMGKTDREITVWQKRVIFEYKQGAVMALKFDEGSHLIINEHLSPEESWQKGQYQYYVPDLSLDGYIFKKGKWVFVKDADARNNKTNVDKYYKDPTKDPNAPPER